MSDINKENLADMFSKTFEYAASKDSSNEEKKEVVSFLCNFLKKCEEKDKELSQAAINKIIANCSGETKETCNKLLAEALKK